MGHLKLIITAHPTSGSGEDAKPDWNGNCGTYMAKINPEKFSLNKKVVIESSNSGDTSGSISKFKGYDPDSLSFDLMFDGTGVINDETNVESEITKLTNTIYAYHGEDHKPPYLIVMWKSLVFKCLLESFNTEYTLFKPDGTPIRAKVSLSFKEYLDAALEAKKVKKSSPDLTHVKTVRVGDSLPLMCRDVYGDVGYYSLVAEANGLVNFRELEVGSKLYFPPLER